ncbi:hypothetical protein DFW101_3531 [Solidesulfovibrio carbinoliphilus subsp. oakridgensis]|uniref:Uncharacterized protein n=1 Tax=Solidesulfovibrio carbinoliphilus subsp. oakridgensis TaxID=694327 RepID=G7QC81_9BACT|nr:hypothetical protein [Solidesulfovibrio carbinoliphilus]EHJ49527.1 hypothetical protein DFW101_3531 [Solidesulfovibrio carbinoliphilus subsp. oakridgensis]
MNLLAPESYLAASQAERAAVVNGCGPGGWRVDLIPDHLFGLCITEPCNIHDWGYGEGGDEAKRLEDDIRLYLNICITVLEAGGPLESARMAGAAIFYRSVRECGAQFFGAKQ